MALEDENLTTQDNEPSLRESLAANLAALDTESTDDKTADDTASATIAKGDALPSVDTETAEQRADRLRDEKGRFAPGKAEAPAVTQVDPKVAPSPVSTVEPPSTWNAQEKLAFKGAAPEVQQAILRREANYASGVSTYKQEFDRVKPLADAIEPMLPLLQQFGRDPGEWIQSMGRVHQTFAMGTPQQKVQATLKLLQDYNVPLSDFLAQGGQLPQFNPNMPIPQQVAPPQPDVRALVQAELQAHATQQEVKGFAEAKDAQGNPKYPHFSTVREDMIGLLQAGLAKDLDSAYNKAIRTHDDIWQQEQTARAQADAAAKAAAKQAVVARARRNTVSLASSTPNAGDSGGDKGLRETLTENLRQVAGGRV